jgi:hypothetical protein
MFNTIRDTLTDWFRGGSDADLFRANQCADEGDEDPPKLTHAQEVDDAPEAANGPDELPPKLTHAQEAVEWLGAYDGPRSSLPAAGAQVVWDVALPMMREQAALVRFALACGGVGSVNNPELKALARELVCAWYRINPDDVPEAPPPRGTPVRFDGA